MSKFIAEACVQESETTDDALDVVALEEDCIEASEPRLSVDGLAPV